MRRAAARDRNEPEIVETFRKAGRFVTRLSGKGVTDLLVIRPSPDVPVFVVDSIDQALDLVQLDEPIMLVEVKDIRDDRVTREPLTPQQVEWHSLAMGVPFG